MNVVTIFCCGTGEYCDLTDPEVRADNIVPSTFHRTGGGRKYLTQGVGQTAFGIPKASKHKRRAAKGKTFNANSERSYWGIKALGAGVLDNIVLASDWLADEMAADHKPPVTTVNLCGWSRGAVTCIVLSHTIQAMFGNDAPEVNIFAIDPVQGGVGSVANPFHKSKRHGGFDQTGVAGNARTLPLCVNEYTAVLAESLGGLAPVFRNMSPSTDGTPAIKTEYPFPGSHSDVAKTKNDIGRISASICHKFLAAHGTVINGTDALEETQELEAYARILTSKSSREKKSLFSKKTKFVKYTASTWRAAIVRNPQRAHAFFVNDHHAALFERHLPHVAQAIAAGEEIAYYQQNLMAYRFPDTLAALQMVGYLDG